jgi:hypothetical protein
MTDEEFYPAEIKPKVNAVDAYKRIDEINDRCDKIEAELAEEHEPSHIGDVPDDDLTEEETADIKAKAEERRQAVIERDKDLPKIEIAPGFEVVASAPEPTHFEYVIDLGDMPITGDERMDVSVGILKALEKSLDGLDEHLTPEKVKAYNLQLQKMLDSGITLYNLMLGTWAIEKVFKVGQAVYFTYYGVDHLGHVETIGKSKVLIKFVHHNKDNPKEETEILTWRDRSQVKVP